MNWTKCEDRLPDSHEPVLVTGVMMNGKKTVWADMRWNEDRWQVLGNSVVGEWDDVLDMEITHWMPYPGPAED